MQITAKYNHSKLGTAMFNITAAWTKFLIKYKWLYYILACTWGIFMTLVGLLITLVLAIAKIFSKKISFKKYDLIYAISVGPDYWGGFDCGLMFIRDQKSSSDYLDAHEFGHTFQNCLLGPFMIFVVTIPSAIRWWARVLFPKKNWPAYNAAWFEDSASECGSYAHDYLKSKN